MNRDGYDLEIEKGKKVSQVVYREVKNTPRNIKITYSNGRKVDWNKYMEMRLRNDLQEQYTEQVLDSNSQQELYYCDGFSDCAEDHRPYQNKYYVKAFASSKYPNLKTVEEITAYPNGVGLMTRWNCRHTLHPVEKIGDIPDVKHDSDRDRQVIERKLLLEKSIRDLRFKIQLLSGELKGLKPSDDEYYGIKSQLEQAMTTLSLHKRKLELLNNKYPNIE